jgi:hypothetical protein
MSVNNAKVIDVLKALEAAGNAGKTKVVGFNDYCSIGS